MATYTDKYTLVQQASDGTNFQLSGVKSTDDKKWYILEDDCGVARTRQETSKTMKDLLVNLVEDYEYDNNLR